MDVQDIYNRTEQIIGKAKLEKIKNANVCICGIGGVGSYALEALARIGIGKITIIDKDIVDVTNINRQLIATVDNVGKSKAGEGKKRINSINPLISVTAIEDCINATNVNEYITKEFDYVIDAIDSVDSKIAIICRCKKLNVPVISSMGMANRLNPSLIKISDISKTEMCPLAKIVRKRLKQQGITKVKVAFSIEKSIKTNDKTLGSVSFVPSVAGLLIASEVIKDIIDLG